MSSLEPKKLFAILGLAATLLIAENSAHAIDARVLPKGRSRLGMAYAQTGDVSQSFNGTSERESLTSDYNFDLSSANIARIRPEIQELVQVLNNSGWRYNAAAHDESSRGLTRDPLYPALGDALSRGFLGVDAHALRQQANLSIQHGVTDRLSLGLVLPFIRTRVQVSHALLGVNSAEDAFVAFDAPRGTHFAPEILEALNLVRSVSAETFQTMLQDRGYTRFESTDRSGLGDLVFGGRYCYFGAPSGGSDWILSAQAGFTAPTGRVRLPSELTEVDMGDGTWDTGISHLANYTPVRWLTLSNSINYTHRFWSKRRMRVRQDPSDLIPDASSEEDVAMLLGNKLSTTVGVQVNVTSAFSIDANYEWWWKRPDKFEGSRAGRDYGYLSEETDRYTETLELGASLTSVPAFIRGELPAPMQISALLHLPLRGRNVIISPFASAELALYF